MRPLVDHSAVTDGRSHHRASTIEVHDTGTAGALGELSRFRREFYDCLAARADTLFELTDGAPRGAGVPDGGEKTTHLSVVVAAG
jgi:hypothetical protein